MSIMSVQPVEASADAVQVFDLIQACGVPQVHWFGDLDFATHVFQKQDDLHSVAVYWNERTHLFAFNGEGSYPDFTVPLLTWPGRQPKSVLSEVSAENALTVWQLLVARGESHGVPLERVSDVLALYFSGRDHIDDVDEFYTFDECAQLVSFGFDTEILADILDCNVPASALIEAHADGVFLEHVLELYPDLNPYNKN
jgi:hypothetical protein